MNGNNFLRKLFPRSYAAAGFLVRVVQIPLMGGGWLAGVFWHSLQTGFDIGRHH